MNSLYAQIWHCWKWACRRSDELLYGGFSLAVAAISVWFLYWVITDVNDDRDCRDLQKLRNAEGAHVTRKGECLLMFNGKWEPIE